MDLNLTSNIIQEFIIALDQEIAAIKRGKGGRVGMGYNHDAIYVVMYSHRKSGYIDVEL